MNAKFQPRTGTYPGARLVLPTADQTARVAREDARVMLASRLRLLLAGMPLAVSLPTETLAEIIDALEA